MASRSIPVERRFWTKVYETESCWLWLASRTGQGYGQITVQGTPKLAHRISYELLAGPIPDGLVLDHLCHVRHCVNPAHLQVTTIQRNSSRERNPFAGNPVNRAKTHCKRGHPFDEQNTHYRNTGGRSCRACRRKVA